MVQRGTALFLLWAAMLVGAPGLVLADDALKQQLLHLGERDQAEIAREEGARPEVLEGMVAELKQIIAERGWPRLSAVGPEAATAAWLVAQHADTDRVFQRDALARIAALASVGEADLRYVGYLTDRIEVGKGRLQLYGTQGGCEGARWTALPSVEPEGLDERRRSLGMERHADYEAMGSIMLCARAAE
jgi:hypothetical protein